MKSISIKLKLIILLTSSLIILAFSLTYVSVSRTVDILVNTNYEHLTEARDSKIKQLRVMFDLYLKQIQLLQETNYVRGLSNEFLDFYNKIEISKYDKFPVDNSLVKEALPKWDIFYKKYVNTYPFDDVLVISADTGHVLYTYEKKNDFGANLVVGEYKDSALAKLWRKVLQSKKTSFVDMSAYAPRNGEPTLFLGTPVFIDSQLKTILVFKINNEKIADIMNFRSGYGKTQEDYLVGNDFLMRSDSFLSPNTHSLEKSLQNPNTGKVETEAVKSALSGVSDTKISPDYRKTKVLTSFAPFKIDDDLTWAIISEIDEAEVLETPYKTRDSLILLSIVTLVIVLLVLYLAIQKYIIKSLDEFQGGLLNFFMYLNGEKKEVIPLKVNGNDEISNMSEIVNEGISKVSKNIEIRTNEQWVKDGVSKLNEVLSNNKTLESACDEALTFICTYVNAGVGVLYTYDESRDSYFQTSSYAHVIRTNLSTEFKLKEGIIGQVAYQKKPILLTNIKKDENVITTGTLTQNSYNTYTFPLVYDSVVYGVVEIGSFSEFIQKQIDFFDAISRIIGISILSSIQDLKVQKLVDDMGIANKDLEDQKLKLQEANAYMEEQQQQLEEANANMEEQQQQLEEANANMEEQQQQLKISEQNLKLQNQRLQDTKQEIIKKAEELEKSGKYKSEFLANMSHELRTPLNSIILLSSLLQKNSKQNLNNDDVKKAKTIFDSGNELLRLINDILDLSKVESGKMEVIVDEFNSMDLLKQMKDIFEYTASDKGLEFNIVDEYNDTIYNDKDKISQIIRNLISNAFKFTKKGSITLKISPSKKYDFKISVIDTGIGIPKDKQELIFKAFTQADGSTSREYGGTGLGLSISRELAKLLGGSVDLESIENIGSTFSVELPNIKKVEKKHTVNNTAIKTEIKYTPTIEEYSKVQDDRENIGQNDETYLIIDDDKIFAEVVYDEIKKGKNNALIALTANEGLSLVKKYKIKGILLDLTLPDMDGIEVLKELKSKPETRAIPIHIISSKDKNNETLELGAIGYLQKPVSDTDINSVITTIDSFKEKKIKDLLIVEDNTVHREALMELIGTGINITGVKSASEAIKEVKTEKYDTVIVDLGLEDSSGYEVCEFIKNSFPNLPIIIYTGKDLSNTDKMKLHEYSNSIIIKTANSNERILNEINLFLHMKNEEDKNISDTLFDSIDLSSKNILIVDDDIKNIFVLDAALKEFNASTFTAFNGQEAIDFLHTNSNMDLILMDIMMPVKNGYEAIEEIKKDEKLKHIPIIAVTAKAMKEDREKCLEIGADDYLSKPIDINVLANLIDIWSKRKSK